jgi:hypothetical protein
MAVRHRQLPDCRSNLRAHNRTVLRLSLRFPVVVAPLLALLVFSLSGCGMTMIPFEDPSPRSFVVPHLIGRCMASFSTEPKVDMIDLGQEPRVQLQFHPPVELEASLQFLPDWSFTGGVRGDGDLPRYDMDISWKSRGGHGQHCYQFVVEGADEDDEDLPVMGVVGISPRGAMVLATDGLDDDSYAAEVELDRRMAPPLLPTVPVGVGARWHFRSEGRTRGVLVEVDATYALMARDGNHLQLQLERRIVRPEQTVRGHQGGSQHLEAFMQHAFITLDVDLQSRPFPAQRLFDAQGHEMERIMAAYR